MEDILKGNFKVKKPIQQTSGTQKIDSISEARRERMLGCLGGSMVYIEPEKLIWDGDEF